MDYVVTLAVGFAIGWCYHWLHKRGASRPLSLRAATRYEFTPPVRVAPLHRREHWAVWTHRYITLAEVLEHERGTRPGWLPSYTMLRAITGQSWRTFAIYNALLVKQGVIEIVNRGGGRWRVGKAARRAALTALPYPLAKPPPRFDFTRSQRDSVTGGTA